MRLTLRDAVTTLFAGAVVIVTLAVTQGWDWPLLGSPRAGILAVGALGIGMCATGTRPQEAQAGATFWRRPVIVAESGLGIVALVAFVGGLIVGTETWLITLAAVNLVMWGVATTRHVMVPVGPPARLAGVH